MLALATPQPARATHGARQSHRSMPAQRSTCVPGALFRRFPHARTRVAGPAPDMPIAEGVTALRHSVAPECDAAEQAGQVLAHGHMLGQFAPQVLGVASAEVDLA